MPTDQHITQRVQEWAQDHPNIVAYFNELNRQGIKWCIYGSFAVNLLSGSRLPTDIDLVVSSQDLPLVEALSPTNAVCTHDTPCDFVCGDGLVLDFPENSVNFVLDGIEIEVMASGNATYGDHVYHIGCTELSLSHRVSLRGSDVCLFIANPFDVMAIKAVMQRGHSQHKFDKEDVVAVHRSCQLDEDYIKQRSKEMGLDSRAWSWLEHAGLPQTGVYSTITPVTN